jgi:hypothetical protein
MLMYRRRDQILIRSRARMREKGDTTLSLKE